MTTPRSTPPQYRSYLLRCWETPSQHLDRPATWRFSLQDSQTGGKHAFPDLAALADHLERELGRAAAED
jgi:hypothetical protein